MAYVGDSLSPTFKGLIADLDDVHLLIDLCNRGLVRPISRRLRVSEFSEVIRSGNVFLFEESSGMVRWTDGKKWSRSRKYAGFLVYEEKVATQTQKSKKTKQSNRGIYKPESGVRSVVDNPMLIKKSVSITKESSRFHLVSYYTLEDVGKLSTPSATFRQTRCTEASHALSSPGNAFPPSNSAASLNLPLHEHHAHLSMELFTPPPANGNFDFNSFGHQHFTSGHQIEQYQSSARPFYETY